MRRPADRLAVVLQRGDLVVVQPGVTLVKDPFRFTFDYTSVTSVAAQQFGTVRDKDNVRFQVEYVF